MAATAKRQPYLHELLASVRAPALALAGPDGQLRDSGVQGVYLHDRRILSRSVLTVAGAESAPISSELAGSSATLSVSVVRGLGDAGADPTVWVERYRAVSGTGATETVTLTSAARQPVTARLTLELACDLAGMAAVKAGVPSPPLAVTRRPDGLSWTGPTGIRVSAARSRHRPRSPCTHGPNEPASLSWDVELSRASTARIELEYSVSDPAPPVVRAPTGPSQLAVPTVQGGDPRLSSLLAQSVADLAALELADPRAPEDHFLGAGAPWYLTLFGRDCLLSARMVLPLGTELAAGTLRTLARRQGSRVDPDSAEEPGKILHEIRAGETEHAAGHQPGQLAAAGHLLRHRRCHPAVDPAAARQLAVGPGRAGGAAAAAEPGAGADLDGGLRHGRQRLSQLRRPLRARPEQPGLEGLRRLDPVPRRPARRTAGRVERGAGLRLRGGDGGRDAAGGLRPPRCRQLARVGRRPRRALPAAVLAGRRARPLSGAGAGRPRRAGGFGGLEHGAPAGHRAAGRAGVSPGRPPARLTRSCARASACGRCPARRPASTR